MNPEALLARWQRALDAKHAAESGAKRISVDWGAYFRAFLEKHGAFPFLWAGKLLFPDGWTYGLDERGPEWPPPEDRAEREKLRRTYWKLRRSAGRRELVAARAELEGLRELIRSRSCPIFHRVSWYDREAVQPGPGGGTGAWVGDTVPCDLHGAEERVRWLERDLAICELKLVDPDWEPAPGELDEVLGIDREEMAR